VLNAEASFQTANELIAAMDLLEPHVERFWDDVRSLVFIVDQASDAPSKQQTSDAPSKHNLISQHMMLAGFAIENLCKGYLAGRRDYTWQARADHRCAHDRTRGWCDGTNARPTGKQNAERSARSWTATITICRAFA
jgi:hypothetical protein